MVVLGLALTLCHLVDINRRQMLCRWKWGSQNGCENKFSIRQSGLEGQLQILVVPFRSMGKESGLRMSHGQMEFLEDMECLDILYLKSHMQCLWTIMVLPLQVPLVAQLNFDHLEVHGMLLLDLEFLIILILMLMLMDPTRAHLVRDRYTRRHLRHSKIVMLEAITAV
jgi:hypothetical protein